MCVVYVSSNSIGWRCVALRRTGVTLLLEVFPPRYQAASPDQGPCKRSLHLLLLFLVLLLLSLSLSLKLLHADLPVLSKVLSVRAVSGPGCDLRATSSTGGSLFLFSAFPVHSEFFLFFFQVLFERRVPYQGTVKHFVCW